MSCLKLHICMRALITVVHIHMLYDNFMSLFFCIQNVKCSPRQQCVRKLAPWLIPLRPEVGVCVGKHPCCSEYLCAFL